MEITRTQTSQVSLKAPLFLNQPETYSMTESVHFASVCTYFHVTESMGAFIEFRLVELKQTPCFPFCSITKATYYLFYQGWQWGPLQNLAQHLLRRKCLSARGFSWPDHSSPSKQLLMMTALQSAGAWWWQFCVLCHLFPSHGKWQLSRPWQLGSAFLYANGRRLESELASSSVLKGRSGLYCEWINLAEVRPDVWDCSCLCCLSWTVML